MAGLIKLKLPGSSASLAFALFISVAPANAQSTGKPSKPAAAKAADAPLAVGELARNTRHHGRPVRALSVSHDGKYIASVADDNLCLITDAETLKVARMYGGSGMPLTGVAFMRDLTVITSSLHDKKNPTEGTIKFWDWKTGTMNRIMPDSEMDTYALQLSPDEVKLGVTFRSKDSRLYHLPTNGRLGLETPHAGKKCLSVAFHPDSNIMAASIGGGVALWKVGDDEKGNAGELAGENDSTINASEFSPDGARLLTAHADGAVRIWQFADPPLVGRLVGHKGEVFDAAFSPDGKQIATAGQDKTVRLWDAATGKELRRYAGHTDAITCVAFAGRQDRVVTAGLDGTIRLWRLTDQQKGTPPAAVADNAPIELVPLEPAPKDAAGRIRPARRGEVKVPDTQKVQQASTLLKDVFRDEFARAENPAGKQKLAAKLLEFGRQTENEAAERFAAIQTARDLAVEAGAVTEAVAATSELASLFDVDDIKLLVEVIDKLAKSARTSPQRATLAEVTLRLVDELLAAHRYTEAERLVKTADTVARSARRTDLIRRARETSSTVTSAKTRWTAYQAALDRIKANRDDAEAHLAAGKHLLGDGRWRMAVEHLANSSDALLKDAAIADQTAPMEPDQQIAIAERWEKAAASLAGEERKTTLALAAYWYNRALPSLTGLRKIKAEKQLKAIGQVPELDRD